MLHIKLLKNLQLLINNHINKDFYLCFDAIHNGKIELAKSELKRLEAKWGFDYVECSKCQAWIIRLEQRLARL